MPNFSVFVLVYYRLLQINVHVDVKLVGLIKEICMNLFMKKKW